ncbi:MAG: hypothetical protein AMS21_00975 [Gemmatimonas sp. SG8_38_2]|nr:MAG: hypothetical protein AMS21_00975 [Gemmatimonas sp. SG8_38_2]
MMELTKVSLPYLGYVATWREVVHIFVGGDEASHLPRDNATDTPMFHRPGEHSVPFPGWDLLAKVYHRLNDFDEFMVGKVGSSEWRASCTYGGPERHLLGTGRTRWQAIRDLYREMSEFVRQLEKNSGE